MATRQQVQRPPAAAFGTGGWLGGLWFGPCCVMPAGFQEDFEIAKSPGLRSAEEAAEAIGQPRRAGRYRIDNSYLQIHGKTGIRYRYSKCMKDKVRSEEHARWGDIVYGVPTSDEWLRVHQYYLPMCYHGIQVITPIVEPPVHVGCGAPEPEEVSFETVFQESAVHCNEAMLAVAQQVAADDGYRAAGEWPYPCRSPMEADESSVLPRPAGQTPLMVEVQLRQPPRQPRAQEAEAKRPWCLKPSVGTWLRPLPRTASAAAVDAREQEAESNFAQWAFAPPILPVAAAKRKVLEEEDAPVTDDIVPEMVLFADIVGKPGKGDDISPSTCATDTPNASISPVSGWETPNSCVE